MTAQAQPPSPCELPGGIGHAPAAPFPAGEPGPAEPWLIPLLTHELLNELSVTSALLQLLGTSLHAAAAGESTAPPTPPPTLPALPTPSPALVKPDRSEPAWRWLRRLESQVASLQERAKSWPLLLDQWARPTCQPASLRTILEQVGERVAGEAAARAVQLKLLGPSTRNDEVLTYPQLLAEALDCLVRNAVQFTPPGSEVRIRWIRLRAYGHIWIDDNGPGVPNSLLARPFRPLATPVSSRVGGHGWGLRLAHRILTLLSGYLRFFNRPAHGATAYIRLPASH